MVTDENRAAWEEFAWENRMQFVDAIASDAVRRSVQDATFNKTTQRDLQEIELSDSITDLGVGPALNGTGPYFPLWQQSPAVPAGFLYNFNVLSHPAAQRAFQKLLETGDAVIGIADNLNKESYGSTGAFVQLLLSMGQYRDTIGDYLGDPSS